MFEVLEHDELVKSLDRPAEFLKKDRAMKKEARAERLKSRRENRKKKKKRQAKLVKRKTLDAKYESVRIKGHQKAQNFSDTEWMYYDLSPVLLNGLKRLNFESPTSIQKKTFPIIMRDRLDVIGCAETGSGKTLAFSLPLLDAVLANKKHRKRLQGLILVPTRELGVQIYNQILDVLGKDSDIHVGSLVGGLTVAKQCRFLTKQKPEIVVSTPGRFWQLLYEEEIAHLQNMSQLSFFIMDEADRMLHARSKKDFQSLERIFEWIQTVPKRSKISKREYLLPENRRTMLFSATMVTDADFKESLKGVPFTRDPVVLDLSSDKKIPVTINEYIMNVKIKEKDAVLFYLLKKLKFDGRKIVFVNSKQMLRRLLHVFQFFKLDEFFPLFSGQKQGKRMENIDRFRVSEHGVLVCTDVGARGLDIPNVAWVIHYQYPTNPDDYIHRTGRTGRIGTDGNCISIIAGGEAKLYQKVLNKLDRKFGMEKYVIPAEDYYIFQSIQSRVNIAQRLELLTKHWSKENAEFQWLRKNSESMGIEFDSDNYGKVAKPTRVQYREEVKDEIDELMFELNEYETFLPIKFDDEGRRKFAPKKLKKKEQKKLKKSIPKITLSKRERRRKKEKSKVVELTERSDQAETKAIQHENTQVLMFD